MKNGFSIKSLDIYEWPVDVQIPVRDTKTGDGSFETHRFTGMFKHLSKTELENIVNQVDMSDQSDDLEDKGFGRVDPAFSIKLAQRIASKQVQLFSHLWVGWGSDLTDENGNPLPYSDETKLKLLEERTIRDAVIKAHKDSQGGEAARAKN